MRNLVFLTLVCSSTFAIAAPSYQSDVAPLFVKYCQGCHGATEPEGKLNLESFAALASGGEHGAAVKPGASGESNLIARLRQTEEPLMPPKDEARPTAEEIDRIAAWIDAGALPPDAMEDVAMSLNVPSITPKQSTQEPASAVAISPRGDVVAIARYGKIELRSRDGQTVLRTLEGNRGRVCSTAFSPDGTLLATAAGEPGLFGEAKLWNVASGELVRTFTGHRDSLLAIAFSPDGATLATSSYDATIKLWDATNGNELHTLAGHNDATYDVAFCPGGKVLASVSGDRTLKLWDVASGTRLDTLAQSLKELYAVAFHPDGKHLAAGGVDGRIRIWQISDSGAENTNPILLSQAAHESPVLEIAFTPDGSVLISASEDRSVKLWDASTLAPLDTLEQQPAWPATLAISPAGDTLVVGRLDGSFAEYPLNRANETPMTLPTPVPPQPPAISYGPQPPIDQLPRTAEAEPNDAILQANALALPGVATGAIQSNTDADLYRITAKANEQWILEVVAAREQSPLDSRLEVLHADGRPVEQLQLRATRDSELEFQSSDSFKRGMRFANWEEMRINQLLYLNGEVIRMFRQRRGPDSDADFYPEGGSRFTYFGTTARAHALATRAFFVEAYPPGLPLPYNGLPVFKLNYENDDDGRRAFERDSRLTFIAPADDDYLVRVSDVRSIGSDKHTYRLIARRPVPDFTANITDLNQNVAAGSGKRVSVFIDRVDHFDGEVQVEVTNLPPGYFVPSPIVVQAGQRTATGVVYAATEAVAPTPEQTAAVKLVARADVAGTAVERPFGTLGNLQLSPKPKIVVRLATAKPQTEGERLSTPTPLATTGDVTLASGGSATFYLEIERNGFDGIVNFDADNLPMGVIVDNIGLNGIQLLEGETSRTLYLSAEDWVPEQDRSFQLMAREEGGQVSLPLVLKVRKL